MSGYRRLILRVATLYGAALIVLLCAELLNVRNWPWSEQVVVALLVSALTIPAVLLSLLSSKDNDNGQP